MTWEGEGEGGEGGEGRGNEGVEWGTSGTSTGRQRRVGGGLRVSASMAAVAAHLLVRRVVLLDDGGAPRHRPRPSCRGGASHRRAPRPLIPLIIVIVIVVKYGHTTHVAVVRIGRRRGTAEEAAADERTDGRRAAEPECTTDPDDGADGAWRWWFCCSPARRGYTEECCSEARSGGRRR